MQYVIQCYDYKGHYPFADKRKLAKTAIRILSYIAQHQWHLPSDAINILLAELKRLNGKTVNYALLAISYAINNEKMDIKQDIKPLLLQGINKIISSERIEHYPTIIITLSALTKLGYKLIDSNLLFIEHQLIDATENKSHLFYQKKISSKFSAKTESLSNWRSQDAELDRMKQQSKEGLLLSKDQLARVQRQWIKEPSLKTKIKILHIVKNVIKNRQKFEEWGCEDFLNMLIQASQSSEIKIKHDAIYTLNYLTINTCPIDSDIKKETKNLSIKEKLKKAEAPYRLFALKALIMHCENNDCVLPEIDKWIAILNELSGDDKLEHYSQYLKHLLENDLRSLRNLLLNEKHSIKASMALLNAAKKQLNFDSTIFQNMISVLTEYRYPFEAKLNIILVLTFLLQNHHIIPNNAISAIISILSFHSKKIILEMKATPNSRNSNRLGSYSLINAALVFLSMCPSENIKKLLSEDLTEKIGKLLYVREVAHNASCLLVNIVKDTPDDKFNGKISELLKRSSLLLINQTYDLEIQKNISLLLLKSAEIKSNGVNKDFINSIFQALKKKQ